MTKATWKPPNTKILRNACQLLFADSRKSIVILLKTALARRKLIQEYQKDFVLLTFQFSNVSDQSYYDNDFVTAESGALETRH